MTLTKNILILLGSDEGLFAWVVANYALGTLGAEPAQTTGIIELGGASAQVLIPYTYSFLCILLPNIFTIRNNNINDSCILSTFLKINRQTSNILIWHQLCSIDFLFPILISRSLFFFLFFLKKAFFF